jgi:DhnA family fructose-bisphosphate aldolase class Ia
MSNVVEGDFVMFVHEDNEIMAGRVEYVMTNPGLLGLPGSEYSMEYAEDDKPVIVRAYKAEDGAWEEQPYVFYHRMSEVVKIESLSVSVDMVMEVGSTGSGIPAALSQSDMENMYAVQIGKSYNSDNQDEDKWDNVTKACWVGYEQRGMKEKGGRMVPNCVPVGKTYNMEDDIEKAKSVSVGDHVTFGVPKPPDKTESAHGVVERVERSGTVNIAGTNEKVEASADNPVAVIRVYATDEKGKRTKTDRRVAKPFSSLRVLSEPIDNEKMYDMNNEIEKVSAARLQELADAYNKGKEGDNRITVGALRQVYNRGIGAYRTNPSSVRGSVSSAEQWAMGRVNAFMAGLRGKFPRKPFDLDLFPKGHSRSTKKSLFEDFAKSVDKPERVVNLFPESNSINKQAEGWGGSIFDLNPFKK